MEDLEFTILQIMPAEGWFVKTNQGELIRLVSWALLEETNGNRRVEGMAVFPDEWEVRPYYYGCEDDYSYVHQSQIAKNAAEQAGTLDFRSAGDSLRNKARNY